MQRLALMCLVASGCQCSTLVRPLEPGRLVVAPVELLLPPVYVGQTTSGAVTATNAGEARFTPGAVHFEVKLGNLNWHPIVLPDVLAVLEVCKPLGLTVSLDDEGLDRSDLRDQVRRAVELRPGARPPSPCAAGRGPG